MIRSYEKSHPGNELSPRTAPHGRVPIFAVSASLVEKERQTYIDAGFDGWVLKPIDFKRLSVLLLGIVDTDTRQTCLYKPGEWERGGWFKDEQPDRYAASTKPEGQAKVFSSPTPKSSIKHGNGPFDDPISKEQQRLESLDTDAVSAASKPDTSETRS